MGLPQAPQLYQPQLFSGIYFHPGCISRICIYHMKSSTGQVESKTLQVTHPARAYLRMAADAEVLLFPNI